ncbi:SCAMP family protein, partial [Ostertagia ostertagi]
LSNVQGPVGQLLLAIIQLCLFSPCSFLFWFRPVYKAFRNDSSFNFMVFFFVLFFHSLFTLVQTLGVSSYACGWINTIETFGVSIPIALIMLLSALCFTAALVGMIYALIRVHKLYRGSGFSIDKARQEFTNGVMADRNVQAAATCQLRGCCADFPHQATQGRF